MLRFLLPFIWASSAVHCCWWLWCCRVLLLAVWCCRVLRSLCIVAGGYGAADCGAANGVVVVELWILL